MLNLELCTGIGRIDTLRWMVRQVVQVSAEFLCKGVERFETSECQMEVNGEVVMMLFLQYQHRSSVNCALQT